MASVELTPGKRPHIKTEKMQEYMRSHGDGSPQKLLKCPIPGCEKVLTSAPGLRYHVKGHSGPERPFQCERCLKTFKSANGLKYHKERTKCNCTAQGLLSADESEEEATTEDQSSPPPIHSLGIPFQSLVDGEGLTGQVDRLTELAIIATSPQSPLMQKSCPVRIDQPRSSAVRSLEKSLHSHNRLPDSSPPWSSTPPELSPHLLHVSAPSSVESQESIDQGCEVDGDAMVTSSSPFPACPQDEATSSATWTHSWPTAVWKCFIKECRVKFVSGDGNEQWRSAQELADREKLTTTATCLQSEIHNISYAENGLRLLDVVKAESVDSDFPALINLQLTPDIPEQPDLLVQCPKDHPFFVKNTGWSSLHPSGTADHYGIPCRELKVNDVLLSSCHPETTGKDDVFRSFQSHDFTPMDTSAVFALSNMKKQRLDQEMSPKHSSESPGKRSPTKYSCADEYKPKRPMNSFMLFAKKYRLELTQKFPGKDNRAISVMLGDKWKHMRMEERDTYAQEAKVLAEEQKKIHPDCWKRKRSTLDPP